MTSAPGPALSRDRVVRAAVDLADRHGLAALTIRAIAAEVGSRPMSIYRHLSGKDEILDALVDEVFAEIPLMDAGGHWRTQIGQRCRAMRAALGRHTWALALVESRSRPGPATLERHENVLEVLRSAGFDVAATAHAYMLLDAFVFGFVLQEAQLGEAGLDEAEDTAAALPLERLPRMAELVTEHVLQEGYRFADSFDVGLDLVLDAVATLGGAATS